MKFPQNRRSSVVLCALQQRAARERQQLFLAEGIRALVEVTHAQVSIEALFYCPSLLSHTFARRIIRRYRKQGVPCSQLTKEEFLSVSRSDEPQGVIFMARQKWTTLENLAPTGVWLALDEIRAPGNLGTIIRSAEAFGVAGLILLGDAIDPYDPACVRASMGALFSIQLIRAPISDFLSWKKRNAYQLIGTSPQGTTAHFHYDFSPRSILWMGSERHGLSRHQQSLCDHIIKIPMCGRSDSLNVAMAASICLAEIFRQRHATSLHLSG